MAMDGAHTAIINVSSLIIVFTSSQRETRVLNPAFANKLEDTQKTAALYALTDKAHRA